MYRKFVTEIRRASRPRRRHVCNRVAFLAGFPRTTRTRFAVRPTAPVRRHPRPLNLTAASNSPPPIYRVGIIRCRADVIAHAPPSAGHDDDDDDDYGIKKIPPKRRGAQTRARTHIVGASVHRRRRLRCCYSARARSPADDDDCHRRRSSVPRHDKIARPTRIIRRRVFRRNPKTDLRRRVFGANYRNTDIAFIVILL